MFIYITPPITKKSKVQKTKNKIFVIKKNERHTKSKMSSIEAEINNNTACVRSFVSKGFDKYEIHERLMKEYNIDYPYETIEHYIEEYKSVSLKYNENGIIKPNTEIYKEIL